MTLLNDELASFSPGAQGPFWGDWERAVSAGIAAVIGGGRPTLDETVAHLDRDTGWALLGWAERAASYVVRAPGVGGLLEQAVFAVTLLNNSEIDRKDVSVVASLLRRACVLIGEDPSAVAHRVLERWSGEPSATLLSFVSGPAVLPSTHEEVGQGDRFEFRRKPSSVDTERILDWWKSGESDA